MLSEDIKILSMVSDWQPGSVLAINNGTNVIESGCYLDGIKAPEKFHCGIYRPKGSWRQLTNNELQRAVGITSTSNIANTLMLIEVPGYFRTEFYRRQLNDMSRSPQHWDQKMESEFPMFANEVKNWLEQKVFERFEMCSAFVNFTQPGTTTTTYDISQKRYRGLHIDNWGQPLRNATERDASGLRVCVNLGYAARELVFINLRLKSILDLLAVKRGAEAVERLYEETYGQPLVEDFLNECNEYPILKVRLDPCQAYIGPVQNIIHDGYPLFQKSVDVNLQLSANNFRYRSEFIAEAFFKSAHACCA